MQAVGFAKAQGSPQEAKQAKVIRYHVRCPICHSWWAYDFVAHSMDGITLHKSDEGKVLIADGGLIHESLAGKRMPIVDTSKWGCHTLCGICYARRAAIVGIKDPRAKGQTAISPWSEQMEKTMWGRIKHRQFEEHDGITPGAAGLLEVIQVVDPQEINGLKLLDEQKLGREEILGKGIFITREKAESLNLGWEKFG